MIVDASRIIALLAVLLVGCAKYAPAPLDLAKVDQVLRLPSNEELQRRVEALHNPLLSHATIDLSDGLSAGEAAVLAVAMNPAVRAERSRLAAANAQVLQATVLPNPTLSFSLDNPIGANAGNEVIGYAVGLEWQFTSLISQGARVAAARAAGDQVRLDVAWKEWQIAEAARQAFYDVIVLRTRFAEAERTAGQLQKFSDQFRSALKRHDVTISDASAAMAASDDANVALSSAARDLRDAELILNQSLGVPAETSIQLQDNSALVLSVQTAEVPVYLNNLENRRIDLVALRRGYDSQEASVRAAVLTQFPRISLGTSQTRDYGDFLTLGPAATVELPLFDRNQGNIAIEKATREQLYNVYISRVFDARAEVSRAVTLIQSLSSLIKLEMHQVDELRSLVTSYETALRGGNLDLTTFYAAAVNLSQKQSELSKLRQDFIHAVISLELASGGSTDERPLDQAATTEATR